MRTSGFKQWALAAALLALSAAPAIGQTAPAADVGVSHVQGVKIYVSDLTRSAHFYTDVLGLTAVRSIPGGPNGAVNEIILSLSSTFGVGGESSAWVVLKSGEALPADPARFGQLVLTSPDTTALAARVQSAGSTVTRHQNGIIVITDPDGYEIEVLQITAAVSQH